MFYFKYVKLIHLWVLFKTLKIFIHRHRYLDLFIIKILCIIHF